MMLVYNVECSVDNFVCHRISQFLDPYLYLLGIEFCSERIHSDRINRWTLMNAEDAGKLREEFKAEYKKQMEVIFDDITLTEQNDECFRCARGVTLKTLLP